MRGYKAIEIIQMAIKKTTKNSLNLNSKKPTDRLFGSVAKNHDTEAKI